jgi:hypothetical protein
LAEQHAVAAIFGSREFEYDAAEPKTCLHRFLLVFS